MKFWKQFVAGWVFVHSGSLIWAGNFIVDTSVSEVAVDAKASPPHSFTSVATKYEHDIDIDPSSLEVRKAVFSFSFADLDSNSGKRDSKMLRWIDADAYPTARFELKEVVKNGERTIGKGSFLMHGVSRDIEIPFSVKREGKKVVLDGAVSFDYEDWGLEIIKLLIFKVNPSVTPRFHLVGEIAGSDHT
jgi:polyisoprenoid-binding protein YceI